MNEPSAKAPQVEETKSAAPVPVESGTTWTSPEVLKAAEKSATPSRPKPNKVADLDKAAPPHAPAAAATPAAPAVVPAPAGLPSTPAAAAPPQVDPLLAAVRQVAADPAVTGRAHKDDAAAIATYYAEAPQPIWTTKAGYTAAGKAAVAEIRKADDWGLEAAAFDVPDTSSTPASEADLAAAEVKLSLSVLKYARFARGGRIDLSTLSKILDMSPPFKDPKAVLGEIAQAMAADTYLRGLHPQHEQFVNLRTALLKARGPQVEVEKIDPALSVKIPTQGKTLKPGMDDPDVALLRQRLKVPAEAGAKDTVYDAKLAEAVIAFQKEHGIKANGSVMSRTRLSLNGQAEAKAPNKDRDLQRILINMERWRWLPETLGPLFVWNNIPEYTTRMIKNGEEIFKERIVVGLPSWPTPVFSADMKLVIFNPSWGMPDGIKTKELLPALKRAQPQSFFDFFGGGGGGGSVIRAYGLQAYVDGRPVDADSINWSSVDIRRYSFIQPPGEKNPLGIVKFMFPNKHDVYMHDTTQKHLFANSSRAFSHGCMRVQNPMRFAEAILSEDRSWSPEQVASARNGGEIKLEKPFPVHTTYMTAIADKSGRVQAFVDVYGHDYRLTAALGGKPIQYDPGVETASIVDDGSSDAAPSPTPGKKGAKKKTNYSSPSSFQEAMSGIIAN